MSKLFSFEKLEGYKFARNLNIRIYYLTAGFPVMKDFALSIKSEEHQYL